MLQLRRTLSCIKVLLVLMQKSDALNYQKSLVVLGLKFYQQGLRCWCFPENVANCFKAPTSAATKSFQLPVCLSLCDFLRIWSHLLKKSLMENFMFCAVFLLYYIQWKQFMYLTNINKFWCKTIKIWELYFIQIGQLTHMVNIWSLRRLCISGV